MRNILLFVIACVLFACQEKSEPSVNMLDETHSDVKVAQPVARKKLTQHVADTFKLSLKKSTLVYGSADQHNVDVIVEILGPDNKVIAGFDGPARGQEVFKFTTDVDGTYKLVVSPFKEGAGEYTLLLKGAEAIATTPEGIFDQYMRASMALDDFNPGASVAVQKDGKVIFSRGFGYADLEQHVKITPTTIFHIASVSKQFTAFAIAMLADQGKISIDDDIRKYIPELHDFGQKITIAHLAHHTSGLRDQWSLLQMAGWRMDDVITKNQILRLVSLQRELNFNPGDEMVYCNTGYTLMGEIVARVTKMPFSEWCKKSIFDPLGMKNTLFYDDHERVVENRSYSYYMGSDGYKKSVLNYANAGATSLFTTVEDLSLWAVNFEKATVGNQHVMEIMNHKFVLTKGDTLDYLFGQVESPYKGLTTYNHSGGDAGFRSYFLRFPDQHFSVSVFSNLASFNPGTISYQLADLYLSKEFGPEKPKEEDGARPETNEPKFDPSTIKLADFTGVFYSPELETRYELKVENDTLVAHHLRHDQMKISIVSADKFNVGILGDLDFIREGGKITGFKASNGRVRNLKFNKQ